MLVGIVDFITTSPENFSWHFYDFSVIFNRFLKFSVFPLDLSLTITDRSLDFIDRPLRFYIRDPKKN